MKKIQSMIILALLFPILTVGIKFVAYSFLPTSIWIDYKSITVQDINSGETTQEWLIDRNVKRVSLRGTYLDNAFCEGNSGEYKEYYTYRGDALYQSGTSTKSVIQIPDTLPKGQCYWLSNVKIELPYGIERDLPADIQSNIFLVK